MSTLNRSYSSSITGQAAKLLALLLLLVSCASAQVLTRNCATGHTLGGGPYQAGSNPLLIVIEATQAGSNTFLGVTGPTNALGTERFSEIPTFGAAGGAVDTTFFPVPANHFYQITFGSAGVTSWCEYTINTGTLTDSGDLGPSGANTRTLGGGPYTNSGANGVIVLAKITGLSVSGNNNSGTVSLSNLYKVDFDAGGIAEAGLYATQTVRLVIPAGGTYQISTAGGTLAWWREYGIGATFTDPGDQSTNFAVGHVTHNTSFVPWFVEIPFTYTSSGFPGGMQVLTDNSNPPTTARFGQWKRDAGYGTFGTTIGIVMPGDYIKTTKTSGDGSSGTLTLSGSPRLYSLNGIPFAPTPVRQFSNP